MDIYREVSFPVEGDSVAGRIVEVDYWRDSEYRRIVLERTPGDESSRVELWTNKRLNRAIGKAFYAAGAPTLEIGADLTVTFTGKGTYPYHAAKLYQATYTRPEDDVLFKSVGDSMDGRIASIEYFDPSVLIVLERTPGDESSRVELWAKSERLRGSIGEAFYASGARTLEIGADLTVTFTGWDGGAKEYEAEYARPGEREEKERAWNEVVEKMKGISGKAAPDKG